MIEVPQWFLVVVGVLTFAAAHRRRRGRVFPASGEPEMS